MYIMTTVPLKHLNPTFDVGDGHNILFAEMPLFNISADYGERMIDAKVPVIVDNSPFNDELTGYGDPHLTFEDMLEQSGELHCPLIVLPDILYDGEATRKSAEQALQILSRKYPTHSAKRFMKPKHVVVVQGRTWDEFFECYRFAMSTKPALIGIPFNIDFEPQDGLTPVVNPPASMTWRRSINRLRLMRTLYKWLFTDHPQWSKLPKHHLFGMSHPVELCGYKDMPPGYVFSIDSTLPFVAAAEGFTFWKGGPGRYYDAHVDKPKWVLQDLIEKRVDDATIQQFKENVSAMRHMVKTGQDAKVLTSGAGDK